MLFGKLTSIHDILNAHTVIHHKIRNWNNFVVLMEIEWEGGTWKTKSDSTQANACCTRNCCCLFGASCSIHNRYLFTICINNENKHLHVSPFFQLKQFFFCFFVFLKEKVKYYSNNITLENAHFGIEYTRIRSKMKKKHWKFKHSIKNLAVVRDILHFLWKWKFIWMRVFSRLPKIELTF